MFSVLSPFISHLIEESSPSPPRYYRRGVRGEATFTGVTSLIMSLLSVKGKERKKYSYYFCTSINQYIGTAKLLVFNMYTTCIKQQHHLCNPLIYQLEIKRGIHKWYPPYRQISRSTLYRR